jgi:hypothetical protein
MFGIFFSLARSSFGVTLEGLESSLGRAQRMGWDEARS